MQLVHGLKRLYSLDTLDTRFTTSVKAPLQVAGSDHGVTTSRPAVGGDASVTRASHWNTPEYYFYYLVFIVMVPLMFWVPYNVSKASDSEYPKFAPLLSNGWIPGRKVDNSDAQYASFRDNIPYMAVLVILHPVLRSVFNRLVLSLPTNTSRLDLIADSRLKQRVTYDLGFAVLFLFALHGFSSLKVVLILCINYAIAKKVSRGYIPGATWMFNIAILFANEWYRGYPYHTIVSRFTSSNSLRLTAELMDRFGGLVPRWEVLFNICVLRLISFNLDYYWSLDQSIAQSITKKQDSPNVLSERERVTIPAPTSAFNFFNYIAYVLYAPLYLAGPIITFNDYISQLRYPSPSITPTRTILYGVRFLITLLSMELIIHFIYVVAISKANPDWSHYTPFQLSMLGYFSLHHIWLKLLLPWRFFRLWALMDNIDPPENMVRCMSDNYSAQAFWRGWHRSFNRWIVRYIFIPLGGSGKGISQFRVIANLLAVFTFVALWHDISLRLLYWSWLIVLFIMPEIICSKVLFPPRVYKDRPELYRMISGIGAVATVMMMMAANLVGFAVGLDGLVGLVQGITSGWQGWAFLASACATLFVGVQVMFEIREDEKRRGIVMSC